MQENPLQTIEREAAKLSLLDHIRHMEALARQLREKIESDKHGRDWSAMYGIGKGLWENQDAQDYVNGLREDRA
ncbi:MAG: hypothetical protein P8X90_08340 [Desulfobacterales bacterium]